MGICDTAGFGTGDSKMKNSFVLGLVAAFLFLSGAFTSFAVLPTLYDLPASWSYRSIASYSQPRIKIFQSLNELNRYAIPNESDIAIHLSPTPALRVFSQNKWHSIGEEGLASDVYLAPSEPTIASPSLWLDTSVGQLYYRHDYISGYASAPATFSEIPVATSSSVPFLSGDAQYPYAVFGFSAYPTQLNVWKAFDNEPSTFWVCYTNDILEPLCYVEVGPGGYIDNLTASSSCYHVGKFRYLSVEFAPGFAIPTDITVERSKLDSSTNYQASYTTIATASCAGWTTGTRYYLSIPEVYTTIHDWRSVRVKFTPTGLTASDVFAVADIGLYEEVLAPTVATEYLPVISASSAEYISALAASITEQVPAGENQAGFVSTGSQSISGRKAFLDGIALPPSSATPTASVGAIWNDSNTVPPTMKVCVQGGESPAWVELGLGSDYPTTPESIMIANFPSMVATNTTLAMTGHSLGKTNHGSGPFSCTISKEEIDYRDIWIDDDCEWGYFQGETPQEWHKYYDMLDGNPTTFCRLFAAPGATPYTSYEYYDSTPIGTITMAAFRMPQNLTHAPASWTFSWSDYGSSSWTIVASGVVTAESGEWVFTPEFSNIGDDTGTIDRLYKFEFGARQVVEKDRFDDDCYAVEIAEFRLLNSTVATLSADFDTFSPFYPPASFSVDTPTILPTTATPTIPATGTLWMDGNLVPPKMKAFDGSAWHELW